MTSRAVDIYEIRVPSSMKVSFDQTRPMSLSKRFSRALRLSPSRRTSMASSC